MYLDLHFLGYVVAELILKPTKIHFIH